MRQLFAIVLIALVASAAAMTNCSAIKEPAESANFYMPPDSCTKAVPALDQCKSGFETCVQAANADGKCANVQPCAKSYIDCITFTPVDANNANCSAWATSFSNFELYLAAGGIYNGSLLQHACTFMACAGSAHAYLSFNVTQANGMPCPVDASAVCMAPNFEPATAAPNQASFTLTFGGNWDVTDAELADTKSPKFKAISEALQTGIARFLGIPAWKVTIIRIYKASLKVEFVVNDPTFTPAQIESKINAGIADGSLITSLTELASLPAAPPGGLEVTGLSVEDPANPTPPASASSVAALMALVMMVAAMMF